ncbi:LysM peptidoglycan-binding domain-containing protein [Halioglobus sp. HI00S01]|uniref:LysM peptidoglycan-binding domain-containing protein n=1 Tax=Halioglobus sp. HI00S01 TaxID=1822214 RepID=UPI000825437A|nr:LysM domain-containing protein [Halioglobus sp. HI00S01]
MSRTISLLMAGVLSSVSAAAQDILETAPDEYVVEAGDTLWEISSLYLSDPWLWPEIWHGNPHVANPHLIFPGDIIYIGYEDGRAVLLSRRGARLSPGNGSTRLSPTMRVADLDLAIPAIDLTEIGPFLQNNRVAEDSEARGAPYVVHGNQGNIISGPGDSVYVRGEGEIADGAFGIYRQGNVYRDPYTGEVLGSELSSVGNGLVRAGSRNSSENVDGIVKLDITRVNEEVRIGDRVLPIEEGRLRSRFQPTSPSQEITDGAMISVVGGVTQIGPMDIVVVNKGLREGVSIGSVMAIEKTGATVSDPLTGDALKLPDERAGLLMVFEAFEKMSYALVLKASRPLAVLDKVSNP